MSFEWHQLTCWEHHILRDTVAAFKSYVCGFNTEALCSAPESVKRHNIPYITAVQVPRVQSGHEEEGEAALGSCHGWSGTGMQYTSLMSMKDLGDELFRSGAIPNTFITALTGCGKSHLVKNVLVLSMKGKFGASGVWVTSSTRVSDDQVGGSKSIVSLLYIEAKESFKILFAK